MNELLEYIDNKKVLIVGGGPVDKPKEFYDSFDVIVRCNNYKKVNSDRCDIFYSYFGRNIKKTPEELLKDGVKFCINKVPNKNMTRQLKHCTIDMADYRWIYELRKDWWFCPMVELPPFELQWQIAILTGNMPTTGVSAILFFVSSRICKDVTIVGFDNFECGLHNVDEKWDSSGSHRPDLEKEVLIKIKQRGEIKWLK